MRNEAKLNEVKLNYTVWREIKWNMIRQKQKRDGEGNERVSNRKESTTAMNSAMRGWRKCAAARSFVHSFIRFERERAAALGTLLFAKLPHRSIARRFYPHIMMRIVLISFSCDTHEFRDRWLRGRETRVNVSRRYGRSAKGRRNYERVAILRCGYPHSIDRNREGNTAGRSAWLGPIDRIHRRCYAAVLGQDEPCLQRRCENIHACRPFMCNWIRAYKRRFRSITPSHSPFFRALTPRSLFPSFYAAIYTAISGRRGKRRRVGWTECTLSDKPLWQQAITLPMMIVLQ